MSQINKRKNYSNLLKNLSGILDEARRKTILQVNTFLIEAYWNIGLQIVEYEQKGGERAEYGAKLLRNISRDLKDKYGKGFSTDNLEYMRRFYLTYSPEKSETVSRKSNLSFFDIKDEKYKQLSWSHFVRLLRIKNSDERSFYEIEAIENNWSIRELNRQINSSLFERILLSKDKKKVKELAKEGQIIEKPEDILKHPYILEFTGIDENASYSEKDLETGIIDNLQKFLLELGKGFTFVARQKRISLQGDHFYIDLVLYNRLLKCFVLIDLKIGKITHQDLGQMQMYVNYYDRDIKTKDENSTVGIVLCKENNDLVVKYTLPEGNKQIFSKEYKLYLPKKEELQKLLKKYI